MGKELIEMIGVSAQLMLLREQRLPVLFKVVRAAAKGAHSKNSVPCEFYSPHAVGSCQ